MGTWLYTRMMQEIRTGSIEDARKAYDLLALSGLEGAEGTSLDAFLKELQGDNRVPDET